MGRLGRATLTMFSISAKTRPDQQGRSGLTVNIYTVIFNHEAMGKGYRYKVYE